MHGVGVGGTLVEMAVEVAGAEVDVGVVTDVPVIVGGTEVPVPVIVAAEVAIEVEVWVGGTTVVVLVIVGKTDVLVPMLVVVGGTAVLVTPGVGVICGTWPRYSFAPGDSLTAQPPPALKTCTSRRFLPVGFITSVHVPLR